MMQTYALVISLGLIVVLAALFWWIVRTASDKQPAAIKAEGLRAGLFFGFVLLGFAVTYFSLRPWPHDAQAIEGSVPVTATGAQWSWELSRDTVPLGKPIVFSVGASDVNHGFAVYDEDGTLLFQTQAMPGYINKVRYVFDKPGTYRVLCLEYCGVAHHEMTAEFRVVQ